jgi:S-adenosylmethionine synthetase
MYGLAAAAFIAVALLALSRFGARREKEGAMKVAAAAASAVIKNMERYREIHSEVKQLPLSDRAARLRQTDRNG